ncbi:MAG TPA: hypothetical protein VNZ52_06695 [Candidatus Thermoplasmatota archaeon]|nr:hypothetical protein [Candidatus Thermoplasmatota archaeon]
MRNATFYLTESSKHTGTAYQAGPEVVLPEGRILNATVTATWVPTLPTADRLTVQLQTESRPSPTLAEATGESPLVFAVPGEVFVHRTQIGYGAQNDGSMDSIILHQEVTFRFEFLVEAPPPEATTP